LHQAQVVVGIERGIARHVGAHFQIFAGFCDRLMKWWPFLLPAGTRRTCRPERLLAFIRDQPLRLRARDEFVLERVPVPQRGLPTGPERYQIDAEVLEARTRRERRFAHRPCAT